MSEEKQVPAGDEETPKVNSENNTTDTPENVGEEAPQAEVTQEETAEVSSSAESEVAAAPEAEEAPEVPVEPEAAPVAEVVEPVAEEKAEDTTEQETSATEENQQDTAEVAAEPVDQEAPAAPETPEATQEEVATEVAEPTAEDKTEASAETETPEAAAVETNDGAEVAEAPTTTTETEPIAAPVAEESASPEVAETNEVVAEEAEDRGEENPEEEEEGQEEPEEEIDYTTYTREELADVVDELSKQENFKRSDVILSKVMPLFKAMARARRQEALDKFLAEDGNKDDFEYRHDEVFNRFDASVRLIRDRRGNFYKEREARKEENYKKKEDVLTRLRDLIDGENATTNLAPIKSIQEEWKAIGPVPVQHNRTLWANYNALLDRFYNNRNILFELKDLDRKKNLAKKTALCEKAETLDKLENIKDAIIQLNELHEEYKKIGAVPREVQETLWQRFKSASDAIYKKRKAYLEDLKGELHENLEKKRTMAEELKPFLTFDSDRINDWNAKTKEILAIQKKWDALGGLPREHAKEVNKAFWSAFKGFFSRKNAFFKKLEGARQENLEKKEALVAKANELKDSADWDKTADALKALQRQWKEIGPVPEKHRNSVYAKFKEACDAFFNNKRSSQDKAEAQYVENQKHKEDLIREIGERAEAGEGKADELNDIMIRWNAIGFVPKGAIKSMESNFNKAVNAFVNSLDIDEAEREGLIMKAELSSLKKGPNSDRRLNKKESDLRRKVQELEDNISLWNNNLAFFANSKAADKLRAEFDEKIAKAEDDLVQLKKQLRMVRSM